jgi:sugar/nucleoside kinase (ribokinase family)
MFSSAPHLVSDNRTEAFDVVVAGHLCLDITPSFGEEEGRPLNELLRPGRLVNVGAVTLSTGGAVSNTGLNLIKLGLRARLLGKIGDDLLGEAVRGVLRQCGYDGQGPRLAPGEQTSYSVVLAPPGVDRIFLHNPGANDTFGVADIDFDSLSGTRLFHLGYPPLMRRLYQNEGAELIEIYQRVKELGITTSLDMSLPDPASESGRVCWRMVLERLLPLVDIALFSAEEAMFMLDRPRHERLLERAAGDDLLAVYGGEELSWLGRTMLDGGAAMAAVKCGHRGFYLRVAGGERLRRMGAAKPESIEEWAGRELLEEVFTVDKVVSATGAGDAAIAGFLAAFLRGLGPEDSLKTACCVGAQCVQAPDALSGVADWTATRAMIDGWAKRHWEHPPGANWKYDRAMRVWRVN